MLYLDTETYSEVPIDVGTFNYTKFAELMLLSYAIDDGPVKLWDLTVSNAMPEDLKKALADDRHLIVAHNAQFDREVLKHTLGIELLLSRWRCTLVKAYAHGFSGSLDSLGKILGLPSNKQKLKTGKALINRFCKPAPSFHKASRYTRSTHPNEWQQFCDYAVMDVESLRAIDKRLPSWNVNEREQRLYELDQTVNARGFAVDTDLVNAAVKAESTDKAILLERFAALTHGQVTSPTQRDKLKAYIRSQYQLKLPNTQKATLEKVLLQTSLPDHCRELITLSLALNKSSVAKYRKLQPAVSSDGRFRGGLQLNGAARTRRWSGRVFQPHNLPSRGLPPQDDIEHYIRALKCGVHDVLFDDLSTLSSAALRGALMAAKGNKLVVSDLANIEGRLNAWLSNEIWKLQAYRDFDKGCGQDLYKLTAASILGKQPEDITKDERQILGKLPELSMQYAGGVGAFQNFSQAFGIKMADYWERLQLSLPSECIQQAPINYEGWGINSGIDKTEWLASEAIKLAWRAKHSKTVKLWRDCDNAARKAIAKPGNTFSAGLYLKFRVVSHAGFPYLLCRLPSGNFLTYFKPRINRDNSIAYEGLDSTGRVGFQWREQTTYGGKLVENACQSIARDILAYNLPKIEQAGYPIILTVHDEVLTEVPDDPNFNAEHLSSLLAANDDNYHGLPLAAAGFEAYRYRKD